MSPVLNTKKGGGALGVPLGCIGSQGNTTKARREQADRSVHTGRRSNRGHRPRQTLADINKDKYHIFFEARGDRHLASIHKYAMESSQSRLFGRNAYNI